MAADLVSWAMAFVIVALVAWTMLTLSGLRGRVFRQPEGGTMDRQLMTSARPLLVVAAMGIATVVAVYATGMPGTGLFLLIAGLAGVATALLAPGWSGYLVLLASIAIACVSAVALGSYGGLIVLVIGALWLPASVGWLIGYVARQMRLRGLLQSAADSRVILASATVVGLVGLIVFFALSFATDPP